MNEKQYLTYFLIIAAGLLALSFVVVGFHSSVEGILLGESGVIEQASAFGYFVCAVLIIVRGGQASLRNYGYFVVLILMFGFRELDFDKAFTTIGILKSRFFISPEVPIEEKLIGFAVISLLLWSVYMILSRHFEQYLTAVRQKSVAGIGVTVVVALLVVSKSIDGLPRKLQPLGVDVSAETARIFGSVEEVLELGIPLYIALIASACIPRVRND